MVLRKAPVSSTASRRHAFQAGGAGLGCPVPLGVPGGAPPSSEGLSWNLGAAMAPTTVKKESPGRKKFVQPI